MPWISSWSSQPKNAALRLFKCKVTLSFRRFRTQATRPHWPPGCRRPTELGASVVRCPYQVPWVQPSRASPLCRHGATSVANQVGNFQSELCNFAYTSRPATRLDCAKRGSTDRSIPAIKRAPSIPEDQWPGTVWSQQTALHSTADSGRENRRGVLCRVARSWHRAVQRIPEDSVIVGRYSRAMPGTIRIGRPLRFF